MARYRWVILGAGTAAQASYSAVAVGLPALAPALRSHYGLSLSETGVVLGAVGIGSLPTLLAWGLLADRIGERAVITAGLGGCAVALAATGWTSSFWPLCALLALVGALGSSVNAASGRAVMSWFPHAERGLALGIRQTAIPIGGAGAAASLPWLASAGGTKLAFVAMAAGCLAMAAVAAVLLREGVAEEPGLDVAAPVRDPRMWLISAGSVLYLVGQIATISFVVLFLHSHRGMSTGAAAAVLAVTHVLGGVARIVVGRWSDRVGERVGPLRILGTLLAVGLVVATVLVDAPLALLVPALVVAGVLGLSWNGLSFTAAAETAGAGRSGAAIGFQQTALGFGVAVVPIGFAAIANGSWRTAFAISAACPLLGVAVFGRLSRSGARTPGTSAARPAARRTPG
jgi:sugar phosphate permease